MTTDFLTPDQFRNEYTPPLGRDKTFAMLREGTIKSIRVGKRYAIPKSEVTGLLQRRLENVGVK